MISNKCWKDITLNDIGYKLIERTTVGKYSFNYYEKKYEDNIYRITFFYDKYCIENSCFLKEIYDNGIYKSVNCFTVEEIYACANL